MKPFRENSRDGESQANKYSGKSSVAWTGQSRASRAGATTGALGAKGWLGYISPGRRLRRFILEIEVNEGA